ncbi:SdrD B-like domain-containing protein [Lentzea sp. NPDC058450]|uniref:SdrD B-like domain-containing protein n=1 Tax=Lentzea sp. NPDC058450 TaxID=3346505 RepID=UPI00365D693B
MVKTGALTAVLMLALGTTPALAQDAPTGGVSGVVYLDRNDNGALDPGEIAKGAKVTVTEWMGAEHETTTDDEGAFAFTGLRPETYEVAYELPDGWVVHRSQSEDYEHRNYEFEVVAGQTAQLTARGERPYSEQLTITTSADRDSYTYPSTAKITATLENISARRMEGIRAQAVRLGSGSEDAIAGAWWGLGGNQGIALDPGQRATYVIEQPMPADALPDGRFVYEVMFSPHVYSNNDGPKSRIEMKLTGGLDHSMILGEDRNADQRIDESELVSGAQVVLVNPKDGTRITERTSGADGRIDFSGLSEGEYQALLVGSWDFTDDSQQRMVVPSPSGAVRFLKRAAPAALSATLKFDKPSYGSHETVRVDLTVTNTGGKTAELFTVNPDFQEIGVDPDTWQELMVVGTRIPAGESRTFSATATIHAPRDNTVGAAAWIDYFGLQESWRVSSERAEVVPTDGDVTGVVYVDRNANGQRDPGEEAPDAVVEANGGAPYGYFKTTTDAQGRFTFRDIPSGQYVFSYTLADGWIVRWETLSIQHTVSPEEQLQLVARAERPYNEKLGATAVLDKSSYAVGEDAKITITLTNRTSNPLKGIQAYCNPAGKPDEFGGRPMTEGWGDLRDKGIDLAPNETRTFTLTEKVPESARLLSRVTLNCRFSSFVEWNEDGSTAYDWAAISGETGDLRVTLGHDVNGNAWLDPGEAIPNARVVLMTEREFGGIVTEATSDAAGTVLFSQVRSGEYWAKIDGPWQFKGDDGHVWVAGGREDRYALWVVPGPPPDQPNRPGEQPADDSAVQGGSKALARTGASVLGLGVVALLLVAFGFGARVAARRRS